MSAAVVVVDYGHDAKHMETKLFTSKYKALLTKVATLTNGKVYVSISTLTSPTPMLGLFAGERFEPGDPVTLYGGVLGDVDEYRTAPRVDTHVMKVPGGDWIRDGKPFADCFPIVSECDPSINTAYLSELKQPPTARSHVLPMCDDSALSIYIRSNGIGYMANRPSTGEGGNVCIESVNPTTSGVAPRSVLLKANKVIRKHDEILLRYQKHKPETTTSSSLTYD